MLDWYFEAGHWSLGIMLSLWNLDLKSQYPVQAQGWRSPHSIAADYNYIVSDLLAGDLQPSASWNVTSLRLTFILFCHKIYSRQALRY